MGQATRMLARADIAQAMSPRDWIDAVEGAFAALAAGRIGVPPVVHLAGEGGAFHVKSAGWLDASRYVAVKVNGNFPDNPRARGLPTIQGAILLCDGRSGALLAVLDSIEVTAMRTGAATAVAARRLAPAMSSVATVVGCGVQGHVQVLALLQVLPLRLIYLLDRDTAVRDALAERLSRETSIDLRPVDDLGAATRASQVIVTCTSSRNAFLAAEHVAPGSFVAAVGADAPDKRELALDLMSRAKVVVDLIDQCAEIGELHHALEAGGMTRADVAAELAGVVAGTAGLAIGPDDIVVFDSTGSAVQDLAAAGLIYERAVARGVGTSMAFA